MTVTPADLTVGSTYPVKAQPYATIQRECVRWLWPDRIPLGMLTLLLGDPGVGKSLLTCHLAGIVSRGGGNVLLLNAEDSPAATIRPRLEAVAADLKRVHDASIDRDGIAESITLPDGVAALDRLVRERDARLVVIDPLSAHLADSVNSWRDQSVRRALAPLAQMAAKHGCAVAVAAHLNKARGADPLYRAGGSIGIPAAARSALLLARDPQDPDGERGGARVLAHIKSNVSEQAESLCASVEPILLDEGEQIKTARLVIGGPSTVSAAELLAAPNAEQRTGLDDALGYLEAELADGPQDAKRVIHDAPCSERTLNTAKKKRGVVAEKQGFGAQGRWTWRLPDPTAKDATPKDATSISAPLHPLQNPHRQGKYEQPTGQRAQRVQPPARESSTNCHATIRDA